MVSPKVPLPTSFSDLQDYSLIPSFKSNFSFFLTVKMNAGDQSHGPSVIVVPLLSDNARMLTNQATKY